MKRVLVSTLLIFLITSLRAQIGTWSGSIEAQGLKLPLVFHLDREKPTMDSPDQGVKGITIEVERTATGSIKIKIPSIGATYEGLCMSKQIVGTFNQLGEFFPLTLIPGDWKINRPQTPQGPFPYAQEEISFSNGDAILKGTLVLPEGCTSQTTALIMVTGSGLQNRDEEIFEHKPFAVIADAFAKAGIATLRYDDRGFGESTGNVANCTTEDFKNDALAGIKFLRGRFDKVGIIGHSEGGTISLLLASDGQADFIVNLAGMVISGAETLLWQNKLALAASGLPRETSDMYCELVAEAFDAVIQGKPMPSADKTYLPPSLKKNYQTAATQLQTTYMQYFLAMDMRPILSKITCPVLALYGTKDTQVEAKSNLEALKAGLPTDTKTHIEMIEGVNHLFQHCITGSPTEYNGIEETFAPEVLAKIVEWLQMIGSNSR